jgi:hypothetical protein
MNYIIFTKKMYKSIYKYISKRQINKVKGDEYLLNNIFIIKNTLIMQLH